MKITFVNGIRAGETLEFHVDEIGVGRERDNLLRVPADGVSRYHARFEKDVDGHYSVVDLGSTNGVKVNGALIEDRRLLRENDLVAFGDQTMRVCALEGTSAAPSAPELIPELTPVEEPSEAAAAPVFKFNIGGAETPLPEDDIFSAKTVRRAPPPPPPPPPPPRGAAPAPVAAGNAAAPGEKAAAKVEELSAALKKGDFNLFGGGRRKDASAKKAEAGTPEAVRARRRNLLFFTAVLGMAAVFLSIWSVLQEPPRGDGKKAVDKINAPFVLRYCKEKIDNDNVFRFTLEVKNGAAEFALNDLKSQRHYTKKVPALGETHLELLQSELEKGGFFQAESPSAGRGDNNCRDRRRLLVAFQGKLKEMTVENNFAPQSFERIERAIGDFAASYGMQTISMTPEELLKQATESYDKAEDLFANRNARTENLLMAISRYRLAVEYLDQFSPKPKLWDRARGKLRTAEKLRTDRIRELNSEAERLRRIKEYDKLVSLYKEFLALTDEDSNAHAAARKNLIQVENFLRKRERK